MVNRATASWVNFSKGRSPLACLISVWLTLGALGSQRGASQEIEPSFTREWSKSFLGVAISPDGRTLAVGVMGNGIHLIDLAGRKERPPTLKHPGERYSYLHLAYSPDGKMIAVGGCLSPDINIDEIVGIYDAATGKELFALNTNRHGHTAVAFAPKGKILAVATEDGEDVLLWDLESRKLHKRLLGHRPNAEGLAFSPDGKLLATSLHAEDEIYQWDVATGKKLRTFKMDRLLPADRGFGDSWHIAFSPDGETLAAGSSWGAVIFVDPRMGTVKRILQERARASCFAIEFSVDGKMVATAIGDTIQLWEVATAKERARFRGQERIASMALSPDSRILASGSIAGILNVWDLDVEKRKKPDDAELPRLWKDLEGGDVALAYKAIRILTTFSLQSLPFLHKRLRPTAAPPPEAPANEIKHSLADLDSDVFATREKATDDLKKCCFSAEATLRRALSGRPSLEVRRRVEAILEHIERTRTAQQLQELRALEVLEHIGTAEARDFLEELGKGVADARLTQEAKASLARLKKRPIPKP